MRSVTTANLEDREPPRISHKRLGPWLELANLLPSPPSHEELRRAPVLDKILRLRQWEAQCQRMEPAELIRRFHDSGLVKIPALTAALDLQLLRSEEERAARGFLNLVGKLATTLRALGSAALPDTLRAAGGVPLMVSRLFEVPAFGRSEVWIRNGAVTTEYLDPFKDFLAALNGVDASRMRQCLVCNHFFFALRKDQKACSKRCNAVRRVRDWRANQARHEYRRKLRGAGLLKPARTKRKPPGRARR